SSQPVTIQPRALRGSGLVSRACTAPNTAQITYSTATSSRSGASTCPGMIFTLCVSTRVSTLSYGGVIAAQALFPALIGRHHAYKATGHRSRRRIWRAFRGTRVAQRRGRRTVDRSRQSPYVSATALPGGDRRPRGTVHCRTTAAYPALAAQRHRAPRRGAPHRHRG